MSLRYTNSLLSLLPRGLFDSKESKNTRKLFVGIATEFQSVQDFIRQSYSNLFPANSDEPTLLKWGRLTGQRSHDIDNLRPLVERQLKKHGGATIMSFVAHLKALGLPYEPERVIPRLDPFTCNSSCNDIVWSVETQHSFGLRLPVDKQFFTCNSKCDSLLVQNQKDEVLDYLKSAAPAHARLFFFYDEE